jgi:hypothetical protein
MDFDSHLVTGYTTCCSPLDGKSRPDFTRCGAVERFVIRGSVESLGGEGGRNSLTVWVPALRLSKEYETAVPNSLILRIS